ncbi:MAG TPA: hypothetical protein VF616_22920 [Duganella sp.]|uniref:hypothetical protein n=1 Tax=Duganella sp. TaxID=1904440 RepID=UPI002ED20C12
MINEDDAMSDSELSDEDEFEAQLLDVDTHPELYAPGEAGVAAQLAYLSRHGNNRNGISEIAYGSFYRYWNQLKGADKLTAAGMRQGAQGSEITESGLAVGSEGAASCLVAFAKATINDRGRQRTYCAAIHVDPQTLRIDTIDPMQAYTSVIKPLNEKLLGLDARISSKEYFLIGGSNDGDVPTSTRLCAATLHAAATCGFQITGCLMPTNNAQQVTNAFMTKDGLYFCKTNL